MPFFSIIMPIYQSQKSLKESITSLQNQTFKDIEIILIDDGSIDDSPAICDNFAKKDKRILVIHQKNSGTSFARNRGIEASHGKWLIFVDSDDVASKVMCEVFYSYIKQCRYLNFVACKLTKNVNHLSHIISKNKIILNLNKQSENISLVKQMLLSDYRQSPLEFRKNFAHDFILNSPCAKAYKKEFLETNQIRFQSKVKYAEDLLFNIEILLCKATGIYVNDSVYFYRQDSNSITHRVYLPDILKNYKAFNNRIKQIIINKKYDELKDPLDVYILKASLMVLPFDIFQSNNTIFQSRCRFNQIRNSSIFKNLINWRILRKISNLINKKTLLKAYFLLKGDFFPLFIWYKILKKIKYYFINKN